MSTLEQSFSNELYHYGVLGMKWGVRKSYSRSIDKFSKKTKRANKARDKYIISQHKIIQKQVDEGKNPIKIDFSTKNRKLNKAMRKYRQAKVYADKMTSKYGKYTSDIFDPVDIERGQKAAAEMINNFSLSRISEDFGDQLKISLLEK